MSHEDCVPTDILVELLLKLPVKSLLRCKSVCKRWYSLISSKLFIKSHLSLAPCNSHCRLISTDAHSKSFRLYDHVMSGESFNALDNPFTGKGTRARIFGSCNGLLSIIVNESSFFIWNPTTRRVNSLPYCDFFRFRDGLVGFGFGYDEPNDDYKVVIYVRKVKIYSLKSGSWKTLDFPRDFPRGSLRRALGTVYNGALHWIGYRDYKSYNNYLNIIVSFDLATESFGEILLPDKGHNYSAFCTFGEWFSVVLFHENRSDVWVMKVYGVQDSWNKLVSIPNLTITEFPLCLMTLCITQDGKILLKLKKELAVYDPKKTSFSEIQKIDSYSRAYTIVDSLVSPMARDGSHGTRVVFARSRDTHGFFNSIILRFKKIFATGQIWSCLPMPNVN